LRKPDRLFIRPVAKKRIRNRMSHLIEKYNVPSPRYTSYPTVPYWDSIVPEEATWCGLVQKTFQTSNRESGISLYIHLPFCESLCTYCGCNTRITVNHAVEIPYIDAVLKEWSMYSALFDSKPRIKEIHLGGGTPTFFKPENLSRLITGILSGSELCNDAELSFEGHPDNTSSEHLKTLYQLGFRRLSLGIQDFDEAVQTIINRIQTYDSVKRVTEEARSIGFTSINFDLIYGLPLQTEASISETIDKIKTLHPDRIAFYSYAHVPWIKPGQRKFSEIDLPSGSRKRGLYEMGRNAFEKAGYVEIGMDHFALPDDALHQAELNKTLHRNFMGYTVTSTQLLIGLGVSSISDSWSGLVQNEKKLEDYYSRIGKHEFPFFKGHVLTVEDQILRKHILNIMCNLETSWESPVMQCDSLYKGLERLIEIEKDGLIELKPYKLTVLPEGKPFLRNICLALDARYWDKEAEKQRFSSTI
jgi:oxygen-independent coproporphyrinogen-3 oxidase